MDNLRGTILELLTKHGPMGQNKIGLALDVARTTIRDNLIVLQTAGMVERFKPEQEARQARPFIEWRLIKQ